MFEQSLYNVETSAAPTSEGDLFRGYEIKNWEFGPRIYKILAMAGAANLLGLFIFAQTSLLTMKGCDSPLVGGVCQALDVIYVGSALFGTDRDYIDAVYDKTELGADDEITFVDVTGVTPPLSYPEGYFQLANPYDIEYQAGYDSTNAFVDTTPPYMAPGIPYTTPSTGGSIIDTAPVFPKSNGNVVDGTLPSFGNDSGVASNPPVTRKGKRPGRITNPAKTEGTIPGIPNSNQVAEVKPTPSPEPTAQPTNPVDGVDINKRPWVDLANTVNLMLDKKEVTLESPFIVNATGKLTKEGKLDPKSFKYVQAASTDLKLIEIVKDSIEAINDSGYLQYLKDISGKDFNLLLQQDDRNISAVVQSEMESETRAKSIKSSLDLAIGIAKLKKQGEGADQNDKDDLMLLENAKIETEGKRVVIRFTVPKELALPMIQRKLAEQKAQPQTGTGPAKTNESNTIK